MMNMRVDGLQPARRHFPAAEDAVGQPFGEQVHRRARLLEARPEARGRKKAHGDDAYALLLGGRQPAENHHVEQDRRTQATR